MSAPQKIIELVEDFKENKHEYTNADIFDEENTKVKFLNPFFEELGWNVRNEGLSARFREVVFEDSIKVGKKTKAPDYSFRLGGERIFFVEAKKPSRDIANDKEHAFQVRRYGWSAGLPLCILTDFEELAIYDTTLKPEKNQSASIGRIKYYKYTEYVEKWDEIYDIFSKDAVLSGKFDNYANNVKHDKKGTSKIDDEFLKEIEQWRLLLARNIALRNEELSIEDLNYAVQLTIDRIIFLRIAEDRGIERYGRLHDLLEKPDIYKNFTKICKEADQKYNSGLFHFNQYDKEDFTTDTYTLDLIIDDKVFKEIFKNLYYPNSPYEFSLISTEILGKIYEQFLGKIIRLTPGHQAKVEEKPEVKKAGGVYYTPQYIVDYMIDKTVGEKIKDKTPKQISKIRIIDPACGSGSFLIRAYQYLLDYHVDYYSKLERPPKDTIYTGKDGINRLTIREKKRILKNNIYGVDIDTLAVEVTKLSLLLKVLEDQNKDQLEAQQKLFHERALPNLSSNIKNGNSLVSTNLLKKQEIGIEELNQVKPFNWEEEYETIFENGGFDVVIGNPPYVFGGNKGINKIQKEYFKTEYKCGTGKINLFTLLIEKGIKLLKEKGKFSYIIPNTLLRVTTYKNIREFLIKYQINEIVDLSTGVFKGATTSSIILTITNKKTEKNIVNIKTDLSKNIQNTVNQKYFSHNGYIFNILCRPEEREIINKITLKNIKLGDLCKYMRFGVVISGKQKELITAGIKNDKSKPYLEGKEIDRYSINFKGNYLEYIPNKIHRPRTEDLFESKKIMIQRITGGNQPLKATYDENSFYNKESIINLVLENNEYSYYYILGIINSKLINWYYSKEFTNGSKLTVNLSKEYLSTIPIVECSIDEQKEIVEQVMKILELNKHMKNVNTPTEYQLIKKQIEVTDEKINDLIYKLYNLTESEIKIIESIE